MLESYKWQDGWKSLQALILRAPLCGANKEHSESVLKFGKEEEIPELRRLSESAQLEEEKLHNTDSQMSGPRRPLFNRQTPFLDGDAMTPCHISDAKTNGIKMM